MLKLILLIYLSLYIPISVAMNINSIDYTVSKINEGMFYHQGLHQDAEKNNIGAIANVGFIIGDKCIAVIDSGGSYLEGQHLKEAIKYYSDLPICYVINTHVHPDHLFGNAAFKIDNVKFIGHENLASALAARRDYFEQVFSDTLGLAYKGVEYIAPDINVSINQPLVIDLGNRKLEITAYTTAHTNNDLTVLDHKTKTLWAGDLLFDTRIPVLDGSINGWLLVMDKIKKMDLNAIIPGHGEAQLSNWRRSIDRQYHYFETIRKEIRLIINDLGTIQQATKSVGLTEQDNWQLFDAYHRRNITASFVELEWE